MNKKGFTLIEMLVVIAIIAVLVAIVIPTVSSATDKAGAAANAANLRAVYAELQTDKLTVGEGDDTTGYVTWAAGVPSLANAPASAKTVGCAKNTAMSLSDDKTSVNYGGKDIAYFAAVADTGKAPTASTEPSAPASTEAG